MLGDSTLTEKTKLQLPSEERVWLKHYESGAFEASNDIPRNKTLWDVLEEKLKTHSEIPAIEYFGRKFSRQQFIDDVYMWARAFRAMGVKEDEIVLFYGPFFPSVGAMICALNVIGACANLLKLSISKQALEEETADCKIAVVFDGMISNIKEALDAEHFQKVIVVTAADSMPIHMNLAVRTVSYIQAIKNKSIISYGKKYLRVKEAMSFSKQFEGNIHADFKANRNAFITYSSGTTNNGMAKGTVATNETAIGQLLQGYYVGISYYARRCFNNLPPTASTSISALFFIALYHGMVVEMVPQFSEKLFYRQIIKNKPQVVITTGSLWEAFFKELENAKNKPSLDFFDMAIIGGEGVTPEDLEWMNG